MRSTKKNQQSGGQAEIIAAVKALASEKDISEEMLYNAIEEALKAAYKKNVSREENAPTNLSVTLDRTTGVAQVFARKTITDEVEDPANQISLEDALKIRSDYRMGDIAEIDVTPTGFLRTAAQTAKQVIMQRIREAEQGKIYDEYSEKENEILTAIVQRVEPKGVYVELGRTEGILPDSEWMPGEEYHIDDHIKVYVLEVNRTGREMLRGPQVRVSRIHPGLVKRLFEMEVPEIAAGVVQIKSIAREAGSRTKMAVHSTEVTIDPVGACVGVRGSRIQNIVQELHGERIDIVVWSPEISTYARNALAPAVISRIVVDEAENLLEVTVPDDQLTSAIGRKGQNVKLAAKLLGWKIDIFTETRYNETNAIGRGLEQVASVAEVSVDSLVSAGFTTLEQLQDATDEELSEKLSLSDSRIGDLRAAINFLSPVVGESADKADADADKADEAAAGEDE